LKIVLLNNFACVVQAKKEAKRAEKREQERSATGSQRPPRAPNAPAAPSAAPSTVADGGDTSGSESVSGGDDEPDVDVPAEMVAAVAEQVIEEARLRDEAAAKEASVSTGTPRRPAPVTTEEGTHLPPVCVPPHGEQKLTFSNVKSPLAKQTPQRSPVRLKQGRGPHAEGGHVADAPYSPTVTQGAAQPSSSSASKTRARVNHTATAPSDSENDADGEAARVRSHRRAPRAGETGSDRKVTAGAVAQSGGGDQQLRGVNSNIGPKRRAEKLASSSGNLPIPDVADTQLTPEELEAKNAAALMSLRSMKLKKVKHGLRLVLLQCVNQIFRDTITGATQSKLAQLSAELFCATCTHPHGCRGK
jgi:hypothetical protein